MAKRGLFITFEGGEGSGKSTQINLAADYLRKKGWKVDIFREPGATEVGEQIRSTLLNSAFRNMTFETEILLFLAARAQLVREKIMPAIKKGHAVLLDRYEDSTIAYQAFGHKKSLTVVKKFFKFVRGDLVPKLTFLLDVSVELGMERAGTRYKGKMDRMEKLDRAFHERVRKGFLTLAKQHSKRFAVIDSGRNINDVWADIQRKIDSVLL